MPAPTIGDLIRALVTVDSNIPITLVMDARDCPNDVAEVVNMLTQEAS